MRNFIILEKNLLGKLKEFIQEQLTKTKNKIEKEKGCRQKDSKKKLLQRKLKSVKAKLVLSITSLTSPVRSLIS